ncbi:MAG: tandem-95 repeat protein, partial [Eubacteriales bacterium]
MKKLTNCRFLSILMVFVLLWSTTIPSFTFADEEETVSVANITISGAGGATEVVNGGMLQMSATVLPENATDPSVTWRVETGTGTATIGDSGLLTGTGEGTVTVKAEANDSSKVLGSTIITVTVLTNEEDMSSPSKAEGPVAPQAPTVASKTANSVTLTANSIQEFSKDNGAIWQDDNVFSELVAETEYTFITRVKETDTQQASLPSPGTTVTTEAVAGIEPIPLPIMGGIVNISGETKFGSQLTADISEITYGSSTAADLPTYQWKRNNLSIDGATNTIYILTEDDVGKLITVTVTADGIHATGSVSGVTTANVAKADGPEAPIAPSLESKTATSITLMAVEGQEYSKDSGINWQDSNVFSNLNFATSYTFITRIKETNTTDYSAVSSSLGIATQSSANALTGTAIGTIIGDPATGIKKVPIDTKVSNLKAGLAVSSDAVAEIVMGVDGAAIDDQENTDVTAAMFIRVTAEDGTLANYSIALVLMINQGEQVSVEMDEDCDPAAFTLTLGANASATWSIKTSAIKGIAGVSQTPIGSSQEISYLPQNDYNGADSFIVQIRDDYGDFAEITVNVTINPRNDVPVNTVLPSISGDYYRGATLNATTGEWDDNKDTMISGTGAKITYAYQWQRATDASGTSLEDIEGAISSSYSVVLADQSQYIRIKVTASDDGEGEPTLQSAQAYSAWQQIDANTPPVITEGLSTTSVMDEDCSPTPFSLTLHASDKESDSLTWSIKAVATKGTVEVSATPTGNSQAITYVPEGNYYGLDSFIVEVTDGQGGTAEITVNVTVDPVNDTPSFTVGDDIIVVEDSGLAAISDWAINILAGPVNESSQELNFQIINNTNQALFSVQPTIAANGALTFTPADNEFGVAEITFMLKDNCGTDKNGIDTSASQTFTITVTPVNDAPSFTKGANVVVNEDSEVLATENWATNIFKGSVNESDQTLEFVVSNNNTSLFSVQPTISESGTLSFAAAANANGTALVSVYAKDFGGEANAEEVVSPTGTFTITINPLNDTPTITKIDDLTINEDQPTELITFMVDDVDNTIGL